MSVADLNKADIVKAHARAAAEVATGRYYGSAVLDANACPACAADDGREDAVPDRRRVLAARADGRPGQHEGEEDEHDDRADVDEHEHERHQFGPQDEQ